MQIIYMHGQNELFRTCHDEIPRAGDEMQFSALVYTVHKVRWLEDGEPSPAVEIQLTR